MTEALQVRRLAEALGAELAGNATADLRGVLPLATATKVHLSFFADARYRTALQQSRAGAILVDPQNAASLLNDPRLAGRTWLIVADPAKAAMAAASLFAPSFRPPPGVHSTAFVDPTASLGENVSVGPMAVVEAGATVGRGSSIEAQAYVGRGAQLAEDVHLHPGAKVLAGCTVGPRSILQAGAIVGSDGFGYVQAPPNPRRTKVPQLGNAVLGADVELGANATVDRATYGSTTVGDGCKIDNLVMLGHNVELGADCVLVAQTGIAGSTRLGARVVAGAQSGFVGHLEVADDCQFAARSGVTKTVAVAGTYGGMPVLPHRKYLQAQANVRHLDQLRRSVAQLLRPSTSPLAASAEERS